VPSNEQPALLALTNASDRTALLALKNIWTKRSLAQVLAQPVPRIAGRRFGALWRSSRTSHACSSCHHSEDWAPNWPMDRTLISAFVNGGQMPFGLTSMLRAYRALQKLIQEYFAIENRNPVSLEKPGSSESRVVSQRHGRLPISIH